MIKIIVDNVVATVESTAVLTAGMVKGRAVLFNLSHDWDDLIKTAVFTNGTDTIVVPQYKWVDDCTVYIPPEVLATPDRIVKCGIYGISDGGEKVIPTLWVSIGKIFSSAYPSEYRESVPPTPSVWDDLQAQIGVLSKLQTESKESLVDAINEVYKTGGSSITVDDKLSLESTNPVQNKVITKKLNEMEKHTIDEITPDKVIFPKGATTTYPIGKVELVNGSGVLIEPGGTLEDFFNNFVDEKNPETTDPSVSITFSQAKAYEVGTNVTPSYSASLNPGEYTYGPDTGVTASSWEVTDTSSNKSTASSGSFPKFQVIDGTSYKITAKATHNAGAIPVTNTGNEYPSGRIPAGDKSATSGAVTGYRNTFYGTLTDKNALTSSIIRGLTSKSGKALSNGSSFTITIPVGALRVVFAYPAALRDVTSVKDVNGMNADITSSFSKQTIDVEGANKYKAISYKVYTLDFANANDTANKFTVTI